MQLNASKSKWGSGYVTDIAYLPGYYRHQSPLHLRLACLLGGVSPPNLSSGSPLCYLELGCGHGFGALALAACNPSWRVTGIDFNPAHIAAARGLAAQAGITNARFIEADLATLTDDHRAREVPEADFATLHGLWSWVADPVRVGIVPPTRDQGPPWRRGAGKLQCATRLARGTRHAATNARGRGTARRAE